MSCRYRSAGYVVYFDYIFLLKLFFFFFPVQAAGANALIQPPVGAEAEVRFLQDGHQMIALSNETRNMLRSLIFIFAQYFEKANAFLNKYAFSCTTPKS